MKKIVMIVVACIALTSCGNSGDKGNKTGTTADSVLVDSLAGDSVLADGYQYVGTLPAADGPGIEYRLTLSKDTTKAFHLEETYLGVEEGKDKTYTYQGRYEESEETVGGKPAKVIKLNLGNGAGQENFAVVNDSVLRMVDKDFNLPVSGLNYDLKLKK